MENNKLTQELITTPLENMNAWVFKIIMHTASIMLINEPSLESVEDIDTIIESYTEEIRKIEQRLKETLELKENEEKSKEIAEKDRQEALNNLNAYKTEKKYLLEDFNAKIKYLKTLNEGSSEYLKSFLDPIIEDLENIIQSNDDIEIVEGKIDEVTNTTIEQSFENTEKILNFNIDLYKQRIEQATKTKEELLNIMSYLNLSSADEINPIDE